MAYIFLDESGDLGFDFTKKKTSSVFVITFLFAKNNEPIERIVKKVFKNFSPKEQRFHRGVLHCHKEKPEIRKKILSLLNEKEVSVLAIYLNKKKVYSKLQNEKHVLYNYVVNILLDRMFQKKFIPLNEPINLIASRRETNKFLNQNFKSYLENQVAGNHKLALKTFIKPPHAEKGLQVVDFACWAIFRQLQYGDPSYADLIRQKIAEISPLFP